jgi:hypothetical protein
MSIEGLVIRLSEELIFDILDAAATAMAAGIEASEIKATVRANINDPAKIPGELRRLATEAVGRMGT